MGTNLYNENDKQMPRYWSLCKDMSCNIEIYMHLTYVVPCNATVEVNCTYAKEALQVDWNVLLMSENIT